MSNPNVTSVAGKAGTRGKHGAALLRAAVLLGALSGVTSFAQADTAKTPDGALSMNGITVYGTIDVGLQYQSHGVPVSDYFPVGTESLISKNSKDSQSNVVGSNLGQSKIGVLGREEFGDGWAGVFKLETFFNPTSGKIGRAHV